MGNNLQAILQGNVWLKKAILIMIVSLMPALAMAQFPGGDGTSGDPYQIENWDHMQSVRNFLDAHFILMNDLDENTTGYTDYVKRIESGENVVNEGLGWEPIGTFEEPFTGSFDGEGYTIRDLYINRIELSTGEGSDFFTGTPQGTGLFGYVSSGLFFDEPNVGKVEEEGSLLDVVIKDLHLQNVDISGYLGVGGIAGINEGLLMNVSVAGSVKGLFFVGGIAGASAGVVTQGSSFANVTFDVEKLIELNEGENETPFFGIGGIGGLIGGIGGLIGGIGGLIGYNVGIIIYSNSEGNVGFTDDVISELEELSEIEEVILELNFLPVGYGGLVGINDIEFLGAVSTSYSNANVGGFYGTGGLIGMNGFEFFVKQKSVNPFRLESSLDPNDFDVLLDDLNPLEVRDTYATGTVKGLILTGGLIGGNAGEVHTSYSAGEISLIEEVTEMLPSETAEKAEEENQEFYEEFGIGGLIGESTGGQFEKRVAGGEKFSFSFSNIGKSAQQLSRMVSVEAEPEYQVYNSFWDLQTSGVPISAGGTGLNTRDMKTIFTYLSANWDFKNLWAMEEGFTPEPILISKRNGVFVSYPYFGNNPDAPLQTPAPGLSELAQDRILVGSDTTTELEVSDFDFGSGETITILGLPFSGVLILDGSGEVEVGDEIQKEDVENGDLTYESTLPSPVISIYARDPLQSIQYENDDQSVTLFVDVAARSISYEQPEGWYFFASPSIGDSVGDLLNGIRTDGFTGSTNPGASFPTVYTIDQDAYEWEAVTSINQVLEQGQALLVYVFQDDLDALDSENPELLLSNGPWLPLDGSFSFDIGYDLDQGPQGNSHFLIANPHPININICSSVLRSERVANNFYFWSPSENDGNGGYVNFLCDIIIDRQKQEGPQIINRLLRPLEGFWVRTTDENPSLDIREEDYGIETRLPDPDPSKETEKEEENLRPLSLNLEHNNRNYSGSAHVLFSSHGSNDLDNYDAMHLSSAGLAERYLSVFAVDEENRKYNLQSLPVLTQEERVIPLGIETTEAGNYTFSWSLPSDTPAGVSYYLRDMKTESLTELEDGGRYSFSLSDSEVTSAEISLNSKRNINSKEASVTTHRFELIATLNDLNTGMELPTDITLKQNYPNPFNPTTVIEYQLPQSAQVRLQVYDMSGRQVAELVNEQVSAGTHTISFDASNLSSGVYMYRLQAGATMLTRKLTVVK